MVWNLCVSLKDFNFIPFKLKQAYFFSCIQFIIFFSTTVFRGLCVTLPVLVRIIGPTMQNISIHWTEQQMGLHEYYIIRGYWIRDALKIKYLVCCGSASVMTFIVAAGFF